ncbi:hypothetical protein Q0Z83_060880 [Actinoplanes sichuanensis]|uniref:F5/8 type C domain-containing protein n=1 Tax=Actinoplanes sichuanensis TaxID=512349 RepID=A0ABW4A5W5_9ACTN|nr:hypothetical protein [Actinoplanes sichuanensis]BEL07897.1 hypothetical protein Q0Z83_060880 [Actinoplanes sichuanensis]
MSYRYHWGWFPESPQTVDAAPDGSATVAWTPEYPTYEIFNVVAISRDGAESDARRLYVEIVDPVVDYYGSWNEWSPNGGVGVPGRLGFSGAEVAAGTVTADATGAAEVRFTPATAHTWHTLTVTGHTADGTATQTVRYGFGSSRG